MTSQPNPTEWERAVKEAILEAINEGWFLRSKTDYPTGFTSADVRKIQNTALEAIRKATSEAIGEDEDVDSIKDYHDSIGARDRNMLRTEQREAIGIKEEAA